MLWERTKVENNKLCWVSSAQHSVLSLHLVCNPNPWTAFHAHGLKRRSLTQWSVVFASVFRNSQFLVVIFPQNHQILQPVGKSQPKWKDRITWKRLHGDRQKRQCNMSRSPFRINMYYTPSFLVLKKTCLSRKRYEIESKLLRNTIRK